VRITGSLKKKMSRFEPSLLDKLFGDGPNQPASAVVRQLSLDELKGTVARHIESLLNASPGSTNACDQC
jgi:type VI secretion system protein ImpF